MDLPEGRDDLAADEPAHGVLVRRVEAVGQALRLAVSLGLGPPDGQERADDAVLAPDADPGRRPARRQAVEDRLDLVGGRVARRPQAICTRPRSEAP